MNTILKRLTILLLILSTPSAFAVKWGYTGSESARYWSSLAAGYEICKTGQQQSPINITGAFVVKDEHLSLHYHNAPFALRETPHNLYQDSLKTTKNYVVYNGDKYSLLQIHFHVPSEHTLDGKAYPMEAHLVHQNSRKELLVVALFLKEGQSNAYLNALFTSPQFTELEEEFVVPLNLNPVALNPSDLMTKVKHYYTYKGSLTTPPCLEGVTWIVAKDPSELSSQQLAMFKTEVTTVNARPIEALNGRKVWVNN